MESKYGLFAGTQVERGIGPRYEMIFSEPLSMRKGIALFSTETAWSVSDPEKWLSDDGQTGR